MGAAAELLAGGAAHLGHAVGDHRQRGAAGVLVERHPAGRARVAVPAGLRQRLAAEDQPGARQQAFLHRGGEAEVGPGNVPDGGEAAVEHAAQDAGGPGGDVGRRPSLQRREVGGHGGDVHVRVDQPRHQGHPAAVERDGVAGADRPGRARLGDPVALHHHRLPLDQLTGLGVQDGDVTQQDARGAHGLASHLGTLATL
jgi:hypothetical protein